jgi:hypothetical protein
VTQHPPRLFASDDAIVHIGEGLIARTLPKVEWTHEAHLAACLWIVRDRPDILAETALPVLIAGYNKALGGVNSDTEGYHETITQVYIAAVREHLSEVEGMSLCGAVNALLESERGQREWPMRFYSKELLFSVEARRSYVAPDLQEMTA